jgi:hypothetical protein
MPVAVIVKADMNLSINANALIPITIPILA